MHRFTMTLLIHVLAGVALVGCAPDQGINPPPKRPKILSIAPTSGPEAGGTPVTIGTQRFKADFTVNLPAVLFGVTPATSVIAVDEDTVTATTPQGPAGGGMVDVTVVSQKGREARITNAFTYTP